MLAASMAQTLAHTSSRRSAFNVIIKRPGRSGHVASSQATKHGVPPVMIDELRSLPTKGGALPHTCTAFPMCVGTQGFCAVALPGTTPARKGRVEKEGAKQGGAFNMFHLREASSSTITRTHRTQRSLLPFILILNSSFLRVHHKDRVHSAPMGPTKKSAMDFLTCWRSNTNDTCPWSRPSQARPKTAKRRQWSETMS